MRKYLLILCLIIGTSLIILVQASTTPSKTVVIEGLFNPVGMVELPNGNILIAEEGTGEGDYSAGISLLQPDGTLGRLISGFASNRDSGDLSGVPLVGLSPDKSTVYVGNFNAGHLWTLPADLAESLPEQVLTPDELGATMFPDNAVRIYNPFDITFDIDGTPVVSDATTNGIATQRDDSVVKFIHRFQRLSNPENSEATIDPVPTGMTRIGDEYYVTLLGGCPFPEQGGQLVAIDGQGNQRIVADKLTLPIDVALADDGTIWVLEFARFSPDGYSECFTGQGYLPNTGRLSRLLPDNTLEVVVENLNFPGSVLPLANGDLLIAETFDGQIVKVSFDEVETDPQVSIPNLVIPEPQYVTIDNPDLELQRLIEIYNLQSNPGKDLREGDTELAQLGRELFFDPILSGDKNIACATCHHPSFAMGDGRILPIGTGGEGLGEERSFMTHVMISEDYRGQETIGGIPNPFNGMLVPRNSPTIINSALLPVQFWDGRVENYGQGLAIQTQDDDVNLLELDDALVAQALFPITSDIEMAGATFGAEPAQYIRRTIAERLMAIPEYVNRFQSIFDTDVITPVQIAEAIAAFERQLIFTNSPWDEYLEGDTEAITDEQKQGALLFFGVSNPAINCSTCHSGDLFTDFDYHNLLVPQIGPGKGNGKTGREDWGRANVTFDYRDQYKFRTPGLRNVSLGAPYFHSGAYATLEDAIYHHRNIWQGASEYDPATHLLPAYFSSVLPFDVERQSHSVDSYLADGLPLSEQDVSALVSFLQALTDPDAEDLSAFIPESVPSSLSLDPVPESRISPNISNSQDNTQTTDAKDEAVDWYFRNVANEVGIDFEHGAFKTDIFDDPIAMMGGGLCWIDYNSDGWLDLYLVNSYAEDEIDHWLETDGLPTNHLYRNQNGKFSDMSINSKTNLPMRGNGCIVADFNNDTLPDIHITADGANALLWNMGDGTFVEGAEAAGINSPEWNTAAASADLNGDGWLDLFVGSYIDLENKVPNPTNAFPQDYYGIPDRLYLSNGRDESGFVTFREVTQEVGLLIDERTLGAVFNDFDQDGDLDLYIANDGQPNRLYEYQPIADDPLGIGFRFIDTYETSGVNDRGSGMGVATGDWTGDGWSDLLVTNWDIELNAIYRNETAQGGELNFQYSTYRIGMMGLGNEMTGWGAHFADFDLDTDLDMMTVNGRVPITDFVTDSEFVRLYGNLLAEGSAGQFREWTQQVRLRDLGGLMGRGSAIADFDNDGDLDVAINSIGTQFTLLQNNRTEGNWLIIDLGGVYPGTTVELKLANGVTLKRTVQVGSSYLASEDARLHFGLSDITSIDEVIITWLDGESQSWREVSANQIFSSQ